MRALYSVLLTCLYLGYLPAYWIRKVVGGGYRLRMGERFGAVPAEVLSRLGSRPRCWIHAVSVGEVAAAVPLVRAIQSRWPQLTIVLSTGTETGQAMAAERLPDVVRILFPLDLTFVVRRAIRQVLPRFFIAMETEIWPNFFFTLCQHRIPAMIANGRISDRSFRRYRLVHPLLRGTLDSVAVFGMQSDEDARRIVALGASPDRVVVTGNLKSESLSEEGEEPFWRRILGLNPGNPVWVVGSTHAGEEAQVVQVYRKLRENHPALTLILAPRHPERTGEVVQELAGLGVRTVRRSALGEEAPEPGTVVLLDTIGELDRLYSVADVVFMGGSLVPAGGHNLLEPAARRKPVLFGPHVENFRESAAALLSAGGGIQIQDAGTLLSAMDNLLRDSSLRAQIGAKAHGVVQTQQGAVAATLSLIEDHLMRGR